MSSRSHAERPRPIFVLFREQRGVPDPREPEKREDPHLGEDPRYHWDLSVPNLGSNTVGRLINSGLTCSYQYDLSRARQTYGKMLIGSAYDRDFRDPHPNAPRKSVAIFPGYPDGRWTPRDEFEESVFRAPKPSNIEVSTHLFPFQYYNDPSLSFMSPSSLGASATMTASGGSARSSSSLGGTVYSGRIRETA